jgi:hypothetical protein
MHRLPIALWLIACIPVHAAQEGAPAPQPVTSPIARTLRTVMCERGEQIFHDDFDATTPSGAWGGFSAGEWTSAEGLLRVTYKGGHGLYHEQSMPMTDIVMQMSFRFAEGVGTLGMGMEGGPTGHCLRWNFHRDAVDIQRMPGVGKDAHDQIDSVHTRLEAGRWYTMVMELCGTEMAVTIDESVLLYGTADGIDCAKHSIVLGADASDGRYGWFAHCAVWRATLKHDWPQKREVVKGLVARRKDATPAAVNQLLQEDPGHVVPVFATPSPIAKVARAEEQIAGGAFTAGCKALEKLAMDKDPAVAEAAAASVAVVAAWKKTMTERISTLAMAGDVCTAAEIATTMARFHPGDAGKDFRDRAAALRKDPAHAVGEEYQQLAALPFDARRDPHFAKRVEAFAQKHPESFYAPLAKGLIVQ